MPDHGKDEYWKDRSGMSLQPDTLPHVDSAAKGGYVPCIGVDNKQHVCHPSNDACKCGVTVKRKKILRDDYLLFSCYECTY